MDIVKQNPSNYGLKALVLQSKTKAFILENQCFHSLKWA